MSDNTITITANLTRDPELRFASGSGNAIVAFGIAYNASKKVDGEWTSVPKFFNCTAFGDLAENIAESLTKGMRVVLAGHLDWSQWETQDGEKKSKVEIIVDSIGPDLRWATAAVTKREPTKREGSSRGASRSSARTEYEEDPF